MPAFIHGLSNDIVADVNGNFRKHQARDRRLRRAHRSRRRFKKLGNRLSSHKSIADALLKRIYELGEEERKVRATL